MAFCTWKFSKLLPLYDTYLPLCVDDHPYHQYFDLDWYHPSHKMVARFSHVQFFLNIFLVDHHFLHCFLVNCEELLAVHIYLVADYWTLPPSSAQRDSAWFERGLSSQSLCPMLLP